MKPEYSLHGHYEYVILKICELSLDPTVPFITVPKYFMKDIFLQIIFVHINS